LRSLMPIMVGSASRGEGLEKQSTDPGVRRLGW
jgi:hypothetical protein